MTQQARTDNPAIEGYTVLRSLGAGGMGHVYLARDDALGRRVVIKVISERFGVEPSAEARFLREARAMAAVEHSHVVRVYEYGEVDGRAYLVMEYVEGQSLADRLRQVGKLPIDEALGLIGQIIDGLEAAWEKKLVHRDIKPANVLLDAKNHARVADFGLAKPLEADGEPSITGRALILGTPSYVSPEQARGDVVDCRSDIYSLGIVLYEMLAGTRPFSGSTPFTIVDQHVRKPLPSLRAARPEVPRAVEDLVVWMTQKDPERRPDSYARLRTVVARLRVGEPSARTARAPIQRLRQRAWPLLAAGLLVVAAIAGTTWFWAQRARQPATTTSAPAPRLKAVAVLPFQNNTGDPTQDYFGVGLADLITSRLAPSRDVVVRPTSAVLSQKGTDPRAAGTALAVDFVAYGLFQRSGNQIRVSAHLYDVAADRDLWSDDIRSTVTEAFALQDQIALPLAAALKVKVGGGDGLRATDMATQRSEAYFNYLQGRERLMRLYSVGAVDKNYLEAADFLSKAMAIDPNYAAPKASLAEVKVARFDLGLDLNPTELDRAVDLINEAIRLDERQAEAYSTLGFIYFRIGKSDLAFDALKRAITLEPNNEIVRHTLGGFYQYIGLWDESLQQCDAIERLNPSNLYPLSQRGVLSLFRGDYAEAAAWFGKYVARSPDLELVANLAMAQVGSGNRVEAEKILARSDLTGPYFALALAMSGEAERSRRLLDKKALEYAASEQMVAYYVASTYARLGDTQAAFEWLKKSWSPYPAYAADPNLNSLRSDPRFVAILADLQPQWEAAKTRYRLPPGAAVPR